MSGATLAVQDARVAARPVRDGLPPGPTGASLVQTVRYVRRPVDFIEECHRRYGDLFTWRVQRGGSPMVLVGDPELAQEVLSADPAILRSGEANALLAALLGRHSLLVLDGESHLRERRLMLPPFHGERMLEYQRVVSAIAERRVAEWPRGEPFASAPLLRAIALEAIVGLVLGVERTDHSARLVHSLRRLLDVSSSSWRFLGLLLLDPDSAAMRAWSRHAPLLRRLDALLLEHIAARRRAPGRGAHADVLGELLAARDEEGR